MKRLALVCCLIALGACASSNRDDEPLVGAPVQISSGDTDAKLAQMQTSMTELLERLDVLNERIARLEAAQTATAPSTQAARQPAAGSSPLVAAAESRAPVAAAPPAQPPRQLPAQSSDALSTARLADAYRSALMLVGQGKLADARKAFQQVFETEPTGDLADNALFWMGETYFSEGNYTEALRLYRRVTTEYSEQNKAPDALFKTALAYAKTGDLVLARRTLEQVIQQYPYSSPAAAAKYELKRIKY